ncbi:MAG: 7-cyano-7-deazaguanine synthase QueC [Verrucomicrobiota bacterium]
MNVCVLLSGGMDSVTALYEVRSYHQVVAALSFDYGAKHNANELAFARLHAVKAGVAHQVVALDFINDLFDSALLRSGAAIPDGHYAEATMKQTVVPFRNGIMLAIATGYAESIGAQALVIAAHAGDHAIYPDCREPFMLAMADAMREGTYANIQLLRPFIDSDKAAIARRGAALGIDYAQTWSCYKGGTLHCGVCGTCVERREAFVLAGLPDPTDYAQTPALPPAPPPGSF